MKKSSTKNKNGTINTDVKGLKSYKYAGGPL